MDWANPIFVIFSFIFGAVIGSYLNVFIYRVPMGLSTVKPGSHCFSCKAPIRWYNNLPIISYFMLRGKCPDCGARFSIRYAMVELLTGLLFAAVWWTWSQSALQPPLGVVLVHLFIVAALVAGSFIDLDHFILPDRITIGGIAVAPFVSALVPALHGQEHWLTAAMSSILGIGAGYWVLKSVAGLGEMIFKQEAMGEGDVKLLAALGGFFGWQGGVFSLVAGAVVGAILGVGIILFRRKPKPVQAGDETDGTPGPGRIVPGPMISAQLLSAVHGRHRLRLPFGPFIALGAVVWILGGWKIWEFYFSLFRIAAQ